MNPRRRALLMVLLLTALALMALAPAAFGAAGGGSASFSGGGGGGGGGGGFGGGGGGHAFFVFLIFRALIDFVIATHGFGAILIAIVVLGYFFYTRWWPQMQRDWDARRREGSAHRRETRKRTRKIELAAAEATDENPIFGPQAVRESAADLFADIQSAWSKDDRIALRGLITPTLLEEWERRLDDFDRKGWHNIVEPTGEPNVEYIGLRRQDRGQEQQDRVIVRIEAKLRDYVVDRTGKHIRRDGRATETTRMREYWTLERRGEHWVLASIESGAEGDHALKDTIVQTQWADEQSMHDEALVEGAVAQQAPEGVKIADLADLQWSGDGRAAAMDLSLADGRFSPDIIEIAARRAVAAWTEAVDGSDAELRRLASLGAIKELLHPGDPSRETRLVVRGAQVQRIRVVGLDAGSEPPTMTIDVDLRGRRYIEDRDTTRVVSGSATRMTGFTEHWTMSLTDDKVQPWQIVSVQTPVAPA